MKNQNLVLIVLLTVFFFGLTLTSCEKEEVVTGTGTVKYEVTCSPDGFVVTYKNTSGTIVEETVSSGSWTTSFTGNQGGTSYVTAKSNNEDAEISTSVFFREKTIGQAELSGDYVVAGVFVAFQ